MLKYNAKITVKGLLSDSTGVSDKLELITQGKVYHKDGKIYIQYKESEVTGLEGTSTTIKLMEDKVVLTRSGSMNSQMIFESGKRNVSYYDTPYGGFTIGVSTTSAHIHDEENKLNVQIEYEMDMNGKILGFNHLNVEAVKCNDLNQVNN